MRVPGFKSRIFGRSFRLIDGSRNIVITSAFARSVSNRSAFTNVARSLTPASFALRTDRSTMSGLYSMPIARAPRFAAVITVRPSPDPRSITKSVFVTFAMSSILSTTACGVGTHTTSLPAWPTCGSNGFCPVAVPWAYAAPASMKAIARVATTRRVLIEFISISISGNRADSIRLSLYACLGRVIYGEGARSAMR